MDFKLIKSKKVTVEEKTYNGRLSQIFSNSSEKKGLIKITRIFKVNISFFFL